MENMSSNAESTITYFGDRLQPTNWILESGATCHTTPDIFYFILGSFLERDKYIEFADGNFVTEKQTGEVQIKISEDNGKPFIATLCNVLFTPDLCDLLFPLLR